MVVGAARATPPCASQSAAIVAPTPALASSVESPPTPTPSALIGEGRRHLPDRPIEAVAEQQERQNDLDAPMSPDCREAVHNIAGEILWGRARLSISGRRSSAATQPKYVK